MRSDVKVGSCLSGGIDSSSIVSIVHSQKLANESFVTVTSCYENKKYDEQKFSNIVSEKTNFKGIKTFPNLTDLLNLGELDKIIYHQDQPISGASHYSEYKVFEAARVNGIIVMLDGQGSDEYLCGYDEFYMLYLQELLRKMKFKKLFLIMRNKAIHKKNKMFVEILYAIRSIYVYPLLKILKKILKKDLPSWLSEEWKSIANKQIIDFSAVTLKELSIQEIKFSSIPYQLHSEDRNSMLFSIESRLPFLDHRLVEYIIGLPSDYKIKNGYSKFILREAISELPEEIKYRKDKMGFVAPDGLWIKENHQSIRSELHNIVHSQGIFTESLIERFDRFIAGNLEYEPIYFRAIALNRFCKIFNIVL
jgi:asparagine synthase (glutamine-hydrolysing)